MISIIWSYDILRCDWKELKELKKVTKRFRRWMKDFKKNDIKQTENDTGLLHIGSVVGLSMRS